MNKSFIIFIIIFSLIFLNAPKALANIWSPPTQAPPGGNTAEPLDVSSRLQTKSGPLIIEGALTVNNILTTAANNILTIGQGGDLIGSSLALWAIGRSNADVKLTISGTGNYSGQLNITVSDITSGSNFPYGKINILSAYSANGYALDEFEVQADDLNFGRTNNASIINIRGGLTLFTSLADSNSNDLYVADQLSVGHPLASGGGVAVSAGQNLIYGNALTGIAGNLMLLQVNEQDKFVINQDGSVLAKGYVKAGIPSDPTGGYLNGDINGQRVCIAGDCKTSWSAVGGGGNPTQIKETTIGADLDGKHNADFSSPGANGWQGIKSFALANGCDATWHVCQGWELSYIYTQGISTANCTTHTDYPGDMTTDPGDNCLGWVIGQVTESTIETEAGFMEAGDCYGYKSAVTDIYHSAVWYIDQWGAATCGSDLPVLCCK